MLLRRHREASVKAPLPTQAPDLLEDDKKGQEDPGNTDPGNTDPGNTDPGNTDPVDYDSMSYDDLKALAKEKDIPYASVKKVDLIEALKASE